MSSKEEAPQEVAETPLDSTVVPRPPQEWINVWRLAVIATGQIISLFMTQAESSITSTAITTITDVLGQFDKSPWVFTAYLLTYSAFPIIISKISDSLGRKQVVLGCVLSFVIFSGACGAAQTLVQLIIFRSLKGLGAGGIVAICTGYGFELRPPQKWPMYSALLLFASAISTSIGPLIGAGITQTGQWRWCFLINLPVGAVALSALAFGMPHRLPLEPSFRYAGPNSRTQRLSKLKKLDLAGTFLLAGASAFMVAALGQAAEGVSFDSPEVLTLLVLSPISLMMFAVWQWFISTRSWDIDPVLSWNFLQNRVFIAAICNAWLSGMVLTVVVVQIPQRFMLVNSMSAVDAGVRLLPFVTVASFSSVVLALVMSKISVHVVPTLIFGALLQISGIVGLSRTSTHHSVQGSQYGFQLLAGVGVGLFNVILLLVTPLALEKKDLAVGNGAINQFRILGGSLGLAIVNCASSPKLRTNLMQILGPEKTESVLDRTDRILLLALDEQSAVRRKFGEMYNIQMIILIGIAGAQVLMTMLMWRKKPLVLRK